jgi:hypothetical protein
MELRRHPTREGVYVSTHAGPIASILVRTDRITNLSTLQHDVYCGQYFTGPVTRLERTKIRILEAGELENHEQSGVEITCEPLSPSMLPMPARCLNWQGDAALFAPPFAMTTLITIALFVASQIFIKFYRQCNTQPSTAEKSQSLSDSRARFKKIAGVFNSTCGIFLFIIILHQTALQVQGFLIALDAFQYIASLLIVLAISCTAILLGYYVSRKPTSTAPFNRVLFVTIVCATALKFWWCAKNPAIQINDYAFYWENACKMASGEWTGLPNASTNNKAYVQRAFLYYYPISAIFGSNPSVIPWCNLATQMVTFTLSAMLGCKTIGRVSTVVALPLLIAFPEFWFGTTIASHDVPAMLLLVIFFWLLNTTFELEGRHRGAVKSTILTPLRVLLVLCLGVVSGLLEVQRTYWPILLVTVVFVGFFCFTNDYQCNNRRRNGAIFRSAMPLGISFAVIVVMVLTSAIIVRWIEAKTGKLGSSSTVAYISGVDSDTAAKWDDIGPWVYKYFPAIPDDMVGQVALRRIIHEKFSRWNVFWGHLIRKNSEFADYTYTMYHAIHDKDQVNCWEDRIAWFEARKVYCFLYGFLLGGCLLLRLALAPIYKLTSGEWLLLVFSCSGVVIELLLTEAVGVYDIFLAFPLCFSAGKLVELFIHPVRRFSGTDCWTSSSCGAIYGFFALACLLLVHAAAGEAIHQLLPCFAPVHGLKQIDSDRSGRINALLSKDSVSLSAALAECRSPEDGHLSWTGLAATIDCPRDVSFTGGFLLTGNQRRSKQPFDDNWHNVPVTYELRVNSKPIASGPLIDLVTPRFINADESWRSDSGKLHIELRLLSSSDWKMPPSGLLPSVAVEFPFFVSQ